MTAARTAVVDAELGPSERRRRLGGGLIVFGGVGLAILLSLAILLIGPLQAVGAAAASLDEQRTRVTALLPAAADALDSAATAATNAGASLRTSGQSARDGSALLVQLASAMQGMSDASRVSILGNQPFAGLSVELAAVATQSRALSIDLGTTADGLDANVADSEATASRFRELGDQLDRLRLELEASATGSGGVAGLGTQVAIITFVLLALLLWLAVPAVAAIWIGLRWRRSASLGVDSGRGINQG